MNDSPDPRSEAGRFFDVRALDPRHTLRARIALAFGGLTLLSTGLLVLLIEMTARRALAAAEPPGAVLLQAQRQLLLYGLLLSIVFVVIGWFTAVRITRRLQTIAAAADRIQQGATEVHIPALGGEDEVAALSRSLNRLVGDLDRQATALQQAKDELEERVAERTRKLAAVYDVLIVATEVNDLPTILSRSLDRVLAAARADAGAIHLRDAAGAFRLMAQQGLPTAAVQPVRHFPAEMALFADVMQQEKPLLIDDVHADDRTAAFAHLPGVQLYLGVPILTHNRAWGVLSVMGADAAAFTADEQELLSALADQLGLTVERFHLHRQTEQLAVVEERNRLARELHDSVTQALYSTTLFAEAGQRMAQAGKWEKATGYLAEVGEMSRQALKEMRLLVHKLRPLALEKEGLVAALEQRLKAVEGRAGVRPQLTVSSDLILTRDMEEALYHIAVEALNNALKHSRATEVTVRLEQTADGDVGLRIVDNGVGFDVATAAEAGGLGLTSMQERAAQFDGRVAICSTPGEGTTVAVTLTPRRQSGSDW